MATASAKLPCLRLVSRRSAFIRSVEHTLPREAIGPSMLRVDRAAASTSFQWTLLVWNIPPIPETFSKRMVLFFGMGHALTS